MDIKSILAIISIAGWPVLPIAWIPMHAGHWLRKNLGPFYYIIPAVGWPPVAYFLYKNIPFLMNYTISIPSFLQGIGWLLFCLGLIIFVYTGIYLRPWVLIGLPEVYKKIKSGLTVDGPFSLTRHPVYFSHFMIFSGIFFISGVIATLIVALLDFFVVYFIIITLEERELRERFGNKYNEYKKKVPRFFPTISPKNEKDDPFVVRENSSP
jgi:protein-S-isoprenylcysteine O-methyltransferase Ste14